MDAHDGFLFDDMNERIVDDYYAPFTETCIQCGHAGRLVWHRDEQMHQDCIEDFEADTDNKGGLR